MAKNALLEIGTEEIPSSYIEPALRQLKASAEEQLKARGLKFQGIQTFATPRRLALFIEKLDEKSEDRVEEILGPACKVGRDAQGNFTKAAEGFAARHLIPPSKLSVKATDKGEYFCVQKKTPGEKADKVLKELFPFLVGKLAFPKTMVWEASGFRFARPVRSIIALYGDSVLKITVAGIKSANWTRGLHTISKKKIVIGSPDKYLTTLQNNCIIASPEDRKEVIRKVIESTGKRMKGAAIPDEDLIDEVNFLVEHPVAVLGHFDEKYLALPSEVLITCMRKKQKYFPVTDDKGKLANAFIGIRNGISEHQDVVREGYERVLSARLADAAFFFRQDTKAPLANRTEKLKGVNFQEKLGSVFDKIERVKQLALYLNNVLSFPLEQRVIDRAAELSKADLVTDMVFEFPELQGVMGRIYAAHNGEPEAVSAAIEEHYWPINAEGKLPETQLGIELSLADKIDTLCGDFAVGLLPTGSADPYGLRRITVGIVRIILEKNLSLSLKNLVGKAFSLLPENVKQNTAAQEQVLDFLRQRLDNYLQSQGYKADEIRAVLASGFDDILDVRSRLDAVKEMRTQPDFASLAAAFKRAANILKQADKMKITVPEKSADEALVEEAEKNLLQSVRLIETDIQALLNKKDYAAVLQKMVSIKPGVDAFFDKVMVMAEDQNLRANRLALLKYIASLFFRVLDFSLLQG